MARLYSKMVFFFIYATFTSERSLSNVQLKGKVVNGKFFLTCKLTTSDRILKIVDPSNREYGYCRKLSTERSWVCSRNIVQHTESNPMTLTVNMPISKENCGVWKCTHGGKQDIVDIELIPKLGKINQDETGILSFKGTVFETVFVLSCDIFPEPGDSTVMFLVNNITIDYVRLYNNKCYNKNRACTGNICRCDHIDDIFQMKYIMKKTESVYINKSFEVQITTKYNGNRFQMMLLMVFDGKDLKKLKSAKPTNSQEVRPEGGVVKTHNKSGTRTRPLQLVLVLIMFFLLAIIFSKVKPFRRSNKVMKKMSSTFYTITGLLLFREKSHGNRL